MNTNKAYRMPIQTNVSIYRPRRGKPKSIVTCAGLIGRFQYIIAKTDWDKDLLKCEKWVDLFCWSVIIVSVLFFIPVSLSVLWK